MTDVIVILIKYLTLSKLDDSPGVSQCHVIMSYCDSLMTSGLLNVLGIFQHGIGKTTSEISAHQNIESRYHICKKKKIPCCPQFFTVCILLGICKNHVIMPRSKNNTHIKITKFLNFSNRINTLILVFIFHLIEENYSIIDFSETMRFRLCIVLWKQNVCSLCQLNKSEFAVWRLLL